MNKVLKKSAKKLADDNARGAQIGLLSAIGATVLIFLLIWILNFFVNIPGGIGDFIQSIINAMQNRR